MKDLENVILEYVIDEYLEEDDEDDFTVDSPLITSGIVDSFSMVSLKTFIEKKYDVSIPDDKASAETFNTVNQISQIIRELKK